MLRKYLRDFATGFAPSRQPWMSRPAYRRELVTAGTLPFAVALLEGAAVSVVARFAFGVSDFQLAAIVAAPFFANLTSLMWARLAMGRSKVGVTTALMLGVVVVCGLIALLPRSDAGRWGLVALVVVGRCLVAGMIALRSVVWRANYPRNRRAQITANLVLIAAAVLASAPLALGLLQDAAPWAFRVAYPAAAAVALIGVWSFGRVRVRQERTLLREERGHRETATRPMFAGRPANAWGVLRHDHDFRWYMTWQFVAGLGMMGGTTAFLVFTLDAITDLESRNTLGMVFNQTLPLGLAVLSMPVWAKLLDRLHIARYRRVHGLFMIATQALSLVVALLPASLVVWCLALPKMVQGVSQGGGALAWQLGHNDFADRKLVALYMGIHQTLTGVRGALAPFAATALLKGWSATPIAGTAWTLPAFAGIGAWTFVITTGCVVTAWIGWGTLLTSLEARGRATAADG